jgi:hypothetical protein
VRAGEFLAAPYVERDGGPSGAGRVVASPEISAVAAERTDRVGIKERVYFVPPKGDAPSIGDRYLVYALGPNLTGMGQVVIPTGVLRVIAAGRGKTASTAIVDQAYGSIRLSQGVIRLPTMPALAGLTPSVTDMGTETKVVWILGEPVSATLQHYFVVDASARDGLKLGDRLTLYRPVKKIDDGITLPEEPIASATVVRVTSYGVTAIVHDQNMPAIQQGTAARVSARMP